MGGEEKGETLNNQKNITRNEYRNDIVEERESRQSKGETKVIKTVNILGLKKLVYLKWEGN